jgi:hypothetical protein
MLTTKVLIENCNKALNNNLKRLDTTFSSLSTNQINWKPATDIWSVGECFKHIEITNELYIKKISELVTSNVSNMNEDFKYNQSFMGKMITKAVSPKNPKKVKTFKVFTPSKSSFEKSVIEDYVLVVKKLIEMVKRLDGINLKKIKFSSPVNKYMRLNLGDPLIFIPKHDERHLNQAERIMNNKEFPIE